MKEKGFGVHGSGFRALGLGLIGGVLVLLFVAVAARGAVTLAWDEPADASVQGYMIYLGTNQPPVASNEVLVVGTPKTNSFRVTNDLAGGVQWWAFLTSTNVQTNSIGEVFPAESVPSNVERWRLPGAPARFRFNAVRVSAMVERSDVLGGPWLWLADLGQVHLAAEDCGQFMRIQAAILR